MLEFGSTVGFVLCGFFFFLGSGEGAEIQNPNQIKMFLIKHSQSSYEVKYQLYDKSKRVKHIQQRQSSENLPRHAIWETVQQNKITTSKPKRNVAWNAKSRPGPSPLNHTPHDISFTQLKHSNKRKKKTLPLTHFQAQRTFTVDILTSQGAKFCYDAQVLLWHTNAHNFRLC